MAKRKSRPQKKTIYSKSKDPKWSKEKKIFMIIIGVICSIVALLAIVGAAIKYYRLVTK